MKQQIVLIGTGRVGAAVGKRLQDAGYPMVAVISREQHHAEDAVSFIGCDPQAATTDLAQAEKGDIILLALPDDQIGPMAKRLQEDFDLVEGTTLVHFSGLHPASIMSVDDSNCAAVSIHPLLSFADREIAAASLHDCPCAVEGDALALSCAEELVRAMGGQSFHLPTEVKSLYHAAACIASNYLVTITASARDLLIRCGFEQQQAMKLLIPIHRATSNNLMQLNPETALTGPIVRGDSGTIEQHLRALKEQMPELLELYRSVGKQTVALATASGRLEREHAIKLRKHLTEDKNNETDPH